MDPQMIMHKSMSQQHLGMAMVGLSELDPELLGKIRGYDEDINDLKTEMESTRRLIMDVKGLTKESIDKEFKKTRDEIKMSGKEILIYCSAIQTELENEQNLRKKDKMNWVSNKFVLLSYYLDFGS